MGGVESNNSKSIKTEGAVKKRHESKKKSSQLNSQSPPAKDSQSPPAKDSQSPPAMDSQSPPAKKRRVNELIIIPVIDLTGDDSQEELSSQMVLHQNQFGESDQQTSTGEIKEEKEDGQNEGAEKEVVSGTMNLVKKKKKKHRRKRTERSSIVSITETAESSTVLEDEKKKKNDHGEGDPVVDTKENVTSTFNKEKIADVPIRLEEIESSSVLKAKKKKKKKDKHGEENPIVATTENVTSTFNKEKMKAEKIADLPRMEEIVSTPVLKAKKKKKQKYKDVEENPAVVNLSENVSTVIKEKRKTEEDANTSSALKTSRKKKKKDKRKEKKIKEGKSGSSCIPDEALARTSTDIDVIIIEECQKVYSTKTKKKRNLLDDFPPGEINALINIIKSKLNEEGSKPINEAAPPTVEKKKKKRKSQSSNVIDMDGIVQKLLDEARAGL